MRTKKNPHPVSVVILAHNTQTNRVERMIACGRVTSPATARAILPLIQRAIRDRKTRITF